jgi:hypothetical protein
MTMNETLSHREAFELLPWYVNDTLDAAERRRVHAHLGSCLVCRRELSFLEQLGREVAAAPPIDFSAQRSYASVLARIDASEGPFARRAWRRMRAAWTALRASHPAVRGALLVQAAVILVGGTLVLSATLPDRAPRYETLTAASAPLAGDLARVRVVFAPHATMSDVQALLESAGAHLVDGPSDAGVVTIAVPAVASDALVAHLREAPHVRYAAPAVAEDAR